MTELAQEAAEAPSPVNGTALYNPDDDTLRWSNSERLSANLYAEAKRLGFRLWRGSSAWVATWTPEREDFLLLHVKEIDFTPSADDPQARQERFARRAQAAMERGKARAKAATQGLAPMGEPVKLDHHSAKRHLRAIERSDQNMRGALEEFGKAAYWRERGAGAERYARQKSNPGVVRRRIEHLEAELRRAQRRLPSPHAERWVQHLELRIAFEQARLESLQLVPFAAPQEYKKGDIVLSSRYGKCEVVGVGPKNLKLKILEGGAQGMVLPNPAYEVQPWRQ